VPGKNRLTELFQVCEDTRVHGKIHGPGLASRKHTGAKAVPKKTAFFVFACPYLCENDTVYALDGFVPPGSVVSGLLSPAHRPFLFLARQRRASNNFSQRRFVMNNRVVPTTVRPVVGSLKKA